MNNLKGMGLDLTKRGAQKESQFTQQSFVLSQQQPPSPTSHHLGMCGMWVRWCFCARSYLL